MYLSINILIYQVEGGGGGWGRFSYQVSGVEKYKRKKKDDICH